MAATYFQPPMATSLPMGTVAPVATYQAPPQYVGGYSSSAPVSSIRTTAGALNTSNISAFQTQLPVQVPSFRAIPSSPAPPLVSQPPAASTAGSHPLLQPMKFDFTAAPTSNAMNMNGSMNGASNGGPPPPPMRGGTPRAEVDANTDQVLQKELDHLNQISNVKPDTTDHIEYQIQQLVEGQRHLIKEIEAVKAQINGNFSELEELRRVGGHAKELLQQGGGSPGSPYGPPQSPQNYGAPPPGPSPNASQKPPEPPPGGQNQAMNNLRPGQFSTADAMSTMQGHMDTLSNHASNAYNSVSKRTAGNKYGCC